MTDPAVSVVLAVLNEIDHIDGVLESLQRQTGGVSFEVLVADGGSTDGTRDRLEHWADVWPAVRWIDNPRRRQSHGLNAAAEQARGEVLVRADGHTTYAPDYVARSLRALEDGDAVAAGGRLEPLGTTAFGRAVAEVMTSPAAIGPAKFHHATAPTEADTVYLGAFRREDFLAIGGYRDLPSGVAEDADLYARWRRAGRRVLLDPSIRSTYRPREDLRGFWRQSQRYGAGKAELLWLEGRFPSWRPLAPLALILGLLTTTILRLLGGPGWPLIAIAAAWIAVVLLVGLTRGRSPAALGLIAFATAAMHLGYGLGLLIGLVRGPKQVSHLRR